MDKKRGRLLLWLAGVNLLISAFTFGGGYVVVPMVRKYFVHQKKLFTEEELMDMAAVAQSTPGAIAISLSALAGFKTAGTAGVVVSAAAAVFPPLVILSAISFWYAAFSQNVMIAAALKGMQAGAAAYILDFVVDMTGMIIKEHSRFLTLLVPASFVAAFFLHWNVAFILGAGCVLCWLRILAARPEKKGELGQKTEGAPDTGAWRRGKGGRLDGETD